MIFRRAEAEDQEALQQFDLGTANSLWLREVREIVQDLLTWRDVGAPIELDRQVDVIEIERTIVAVAAHERTVHDRFGAQAAHRYLMVTAVRPDYQRRGLARAIIESVFVEQSEQGVQTFRWLVHPGNAPSLAFNARTFPDAEITHPPEDSPYIVFTLTINTLHDQPQTPPR